MSRLTRDQRADLADFMLERMGEEYDRKPRRWWAAGWFALRHLATEPFQRRLSLRYADHPDYDEAWRP